MEKKTTQEITPELKEMILKLLDENKSDDEVNKYQKFALDKLENISKTNPKIQRNFNVDENIFNQFNELCSSKFYGSRKQDVMSMALLEFYRKYK